MKVTRWTGDLAPGQVLTVHSGYLVTTLKGTGRRKIVVDLMPGEKIPFSSPIPSALYRKALKQLFEAWPHDECHIHFISQSSTRALFASNKPFGTTFLPSSVDLLPFEVLPPSGPAEAKPALPKGMALPPLPPGVIKTQDFIDYLTQKQSKP